MKRSVIFAFMHTAKISLRSFLHSFFFCGFQHILSQECKNEAKRNFCIYAYSKNFAALILALLLLLLLPQKCLIRN